MATGRRALAVAGWSVLIAGSAAPASYAAPGLERRFPHAGGTTVPDEADHRRLGKLLRSGVCLLSHCDVCGLTECARCRAWRLECADGSALLRTWSSHLCLFVV